MITTQEAYDKIRRYFSKPSAEFAVDRASGFCRYRTEKGRKCAVGVLIPDELYNPGMEGDSVENVLVTVFDEQPDPEFVYFCDEAQHAHDGTAFTRGTVPAFIRRLDELARSCNLKVAK